MAPAFTELLTSLVDRLAGGGGCAPAPARLGAIECRLDLLLAHHGLDPETPRPVPEEVERQWQAGKKVDAIRRYRETHGLGLKEARDRLLGRMGTGGVVARIEEKLDALVDELGVEYVPLRGVEVEVLRAVSDGRKIEAIRIVRGATGARLAEARELVEELEDRLGARSAPEDGDGGEPGGEDPEVKTRG